MGVGVAELSERIEGVAEAVRTLGMRDEHDWVLLIATVLSVGVTAWAVIVALRTSRDARTSADAALNVSAAAAEAAAASAGAADALLALERERSAAEYDRTLTKPVSDVLTTVQTWRNRLWFRKQRDSSDLYSDSELEMVGAIYDSVTLLRTATRGKDVLVVDALERAFGSCLVMDDEKISHVLLGKIGGFLAAWRSEELGAGPAARSLAEIRVDALDSGLSRATSDEFDEDVRRLRAANEG